MKEINPKDFTESVFKLIGTDWMLITAGNIDNYNTMTAAWGGMGFLWKKNVCFVFVRPQRYTYKFTEQNENFTLCFFDDDYKDALMFCGTKSGRDYDKAKETGLTAKETEDGEVYFEEARLVIQCRKLYAQDIDGKCFVDTQIDKDVYSAEDYHRMYIGEVTKIWYS